jgi:hypothetical protein
MTLRQGPCALARACLLLLVAAAAASPAAAAVKLIQAGADSQAQSGIGRPDTATIGPSDRTQDVAADPYVFSKSDILDNRGLSQVVESAGSAVRLDGASQADFFVRSSTNTNAVAGEFQYPTHGAASASAFYDFSVDTDSALSFTCWAFASVTGSANAYVALDIFDIDTQTYLRQGDVTGTETFDETVPVGHYGVTITAFSEGSLPADIAVNSQVIGGATANLSLRITALQTPAPVPEPAGWLLMWLGIGAVGAGGTARQGRSSPVRRASA